MTDAGLTFTLVSGQARFFGIMVLTEATVE